MANYIRLGDLNGEVIGYNADDVLAVIDVLNQASIKGLNGSFVVAKAGTHWSKDKDANSVSRDVRSYAKDGYAVARGDIQGPYVETNWINADDVVAMIGLINRYGTSWEVENPDTVTYDNGTKKYPNLGRIGQVGDNWSGNADFPHPTDPISITQFNGQAKIILKFRRSLYSGSGQTYNDDTSGDVFKVTDSAGNDIANGYGSIAAAPAFSTETVSNDTIELTLNSELATGSYKIDFTPTRNDDGLGASLVFDKILYHSNGEVAAGYFIYGFSKSFSYTKPVSGGADTTPPVISGVAQPTINLNDTAVDGGNITVYTAGLENGESVSSVSWALSGTTAGEDNSSLFTITNGAVKTKNALVAGTYYFKIKATDGAGNQSSGKDITLIIADTTTSSTVTITDVEFDVNLSDVQNETNITLATLSLSTPGGATWELLSAENNTFNVDNTGVVTNLVPLATQTYKFNVKATQNNISSDTTEITINVNDDTSTNHVNIAFVVEKNDDAFVDAITTTAGLNPSGNFFIKTSTNHADGSTYTLDHRGMTDGEWGQWGEYHSYTESNEIGNEEYFGWFSYPVDAIDENGKQFQMTVDEPDADEQLISSIETITNGAATDDGNDDDDHHGGPVDSPIVLNKTTMIVTEGGATDNFTVYLNNWVGTSDLIVNITSENGNEVKVSNSVNGSFASTTSLTFNSTNYTTPQTVYVTGESDGAVDQNTETVINIQIDSDGGSAKTVTVTNQNIDVSATPGFTLSKKIAAVTEGGATDNFTVKLDSQPATNVVLNIADTNEVTVSTGSLTFTNSNWDDEQTVTVTAIDDSSADGDTTTDITISVDNSSDSQYTSVADQEVTVTTTDNDSADTTAPTLTVGASQMITTASVANDTVVVITSTETIGSATITNSDFKVSITGMTGMTATVALNTALAGGDHTFTVTITDQAGNSVSTGIQTVNVAGFTLSKPTAAVTEGGATDNFTVKLDSQPTANVVLDIESADTNEVTVSPVSLTFTNSNWDDEQTVTVTAVDDSSVDGDTTTEITISVGSGSDFEYANIDSQNVTVTTTDNEHGISFGIQTGHKVGGGSSGDTVKLNGNIMGDNRIGTNWGMPDGDPVIPPWDRSTLVGIFYSNVGQSTPNNYKKVYIVYKNGYFEYTDLVSSGIPQNNLHTFTNSETISDYLNIILDTNSNNIKINSITRSSGNPFKDTYIKYLAFSPDIGHADTATINIGKLDHIGAIDTSLTDYTDYTYTNAILVSKINSGEADAPKTFNNIFQFSTIIGTPEQMGNLPSSMSGNTLQQKMDYLIRAHTYKITDTGVNIAEEKV